MGKVNDIVEGVVHTVLPDPRVEELAVSRNSICKTCEHLVNRMGVDMCGDCGCIIEFKTRCVNCVCPKGKW